MQLTKKFSADELRKGILSAVAFEKDVRHRFSRWQSVGGETEEIFMCRRNFRKQLRINRSPNGISVVWTVLIEMHKYEKR